jgi:hypothetical protein
VIDKLRLAVYKRYKILEIQEVYEYDVTQYNPDTGESGLFVEYINTSLKLIAEASVNPSWVRTPDDEDRYFRQFDQSEGIRLNKDSIRYNAAKRSLAKLSQLHVGKTDGEMQQKTDPTNFRSPRTVPISSYAGNRSPEHDVCWR